MTRRSWVALPPLLLLVACGATDSGAGAAGPAPVSAPAGAPELDVEVVADGLDHPWDVAQAPDGTLLVDERAGGLTAVLPDGEVRRLDADLDDLFADGETGLMGLALDPAFADNRRFYTCQGVQSADGAGVQAPEIQVIAWTVDEAWTTATRVADPLLGGIPVNADSGRHGGCRVEFGPDGALFVGTGDNALGTAPQDLGSLAGKVLRIDPETGEALPGNPFADDADAADRIWTYGHRNVQGLAVRPDSDQVYSVEHGPDRDDEVNLLQPGADFGWDPVGAGVYDESVPMTAPGDVPAVWSSGEPTIAPSGATFLDGAEWSDYDGLLLIGVQKDTGVLALRLTEDGELVESFRLPELEDTYGRIRTPEQGQDGALYVTTDNGGGEDQVLRVTPAS
ncbi:PQQ-dependent sugar dehydrogenase [Modestobacter sp. VKM Ac-2984]|uniref:PQQ-dependent sugar dehydrogenase n=1 Tax=Modestobacter sp. VKM Ac-2984 TaxID=3004138 RepID=UPI0022AA308A|nr:PQQ-dependent sugar dehydrogenase [Modestobacter sp. VKM Ac-2984]MCZ2816917.1 PQQ-dependent sugar dehydrogenase [Modestobacter sp. VKM Ac-2984]